MIQIYKLNFSNGEFYIGKTEILKQRISHHLTTQGRGSPKLEKAFKTNKYLGYEVLYEGPIDREAEFIATLRPSLNTLPGGEGMSGLNHPRIKYTKEQLEQVRDMWCEGNVTATQISLLTGVGHSTVQDIIKMRTHAWLWKGLEDKFMREPKVYQLYDPDNNLIEFNSMQEFCDNNFITNTKIYNLLTGKTQKDYISEGFSTKPHNYYTLTLPCGTTERMPEYMLVDFLKELDLPQYTRNRLLNSQPSKGYLCKKG